MKFWSVVPEPESSTAMGVITEYSRFLFPFRFQFQTDG